MAPSVTGINNLRIMEMHSLLDAVKLISLDLRRLVAGWTALNRATIQESCKTCTAIKELRSARTEKSLAARRLLSPFVIVLRAMRPCSGFVPLAGLLRPLSIAVNDTEMRSPGGFFPQAVERRLLNPCMSRANRGPSMRPRMPSSAAAYQLVSLVWTCPEKPG
jgi:hypothetical protein